MLWVDKHRPMTLAKLDYHDDLTQRLQALSKDGEIPHLLFYGPPGAGKKTRIMALLREIYGAGVEKTRLEHKTFKTPTKRTIELTILASAYHQEINAAEAGSGDRFVVQEVIKEIAQSYNPTAALGLAGGRAFKVVVLTEVDRLSRQAQAALRRTMEKYTAACRLILCCNSASRVIEPVRSRCLGVRVPAPSHEIICTILNKISKKEACGTLPEELAMRVAQHSDRNLRRALLMLEACRVQQHPFTADQEVKVADWEEYIGKLATMLIEEQSPPRLVLARDMLYELLTNCIPSDVILKTLLRELLPKLDDQLKHEVVYWAAFYEHRVQVGSKEIFHLEAFVAKFMALYKAFVINMFGF
ncbi:replication factor c subunit 3 [Nannochloropsis oceanica]